jgi:acyl carrier protein
MGLDSVELVLETESTFGLNIPDCDAQQIATVGDLIQYVKTHVNEGSGSFCRSSHVFYQFRRELMKLLPLDRHEIRPSAKLEDLIPRKLRRTAWEKLHGSGLPLPNLGLSNSAASVSALACVTAAVGMGILTKELIASILALVKFGALAHTVTRPLAVHVQCVDGTLRDIVVRMTPMNRAADNASGFLTEKEITHRVRLLISEQLGIPIGEVTATARFVDDLGMD